MRLDTISILNYKNLEQIELAFSTKINCFVGNNGMGKTNLLDAIYYLSFCKSHTNAIDSQNICHMQDFLMLQGKYLLRGREEVIYCGIKRRQKKQFKRNKKIYERLADHIGVLPLVMVTPKDQELLDGGSEERRKFIDGVIAQSDNRYLEALGKYNQALRQRNALLKLENRPDNALFEIWEEMMCEYGNYIYEQRKAFVAYFVPIFQEMYQFISNKNETVSLIYKSQLDSYHLADKLKANRERDRLIGFSTNGIHKDDLEMLLEQYPIKRIGSQGQNKTFLISIKLAQFDFLKQAHDVAPILLLDDIFDKLDSDRVGRIVELVANDRFGQIFISDTNRTHLLSILNQLPQRTTVFEVQNGTIASQYQTNPTSDLL